MTSAAETTKRVEMMHRLKVPCYDATAAAAFVRFLQSNEVDVECVENERLVTIPWGGDPTFAFAIAELAVTEGYGEDGEVASAVGRTLTALGW